MAQLTGSTKLGWELAVALPLDGLRVLYTRLTGLRCLTLYHCGNLTNRKSADPDHSVAATSKLFDHPGAS